MFKRFSLILLLTLSCGLLFAQETTPGYFVSTGAAWQPYGKQITSNTSIGVSLSPHVFSISTLQMGSLTATVRTGFGYGLVRSDNLSLIALTDAGVTGSTGGPGNLVPSSVTLGNIGGGFLLRYDLAGAVAKLKGKGLGIVAGVRIAAVTSQSVAPEFLASFSKAF